MADDMTVVWNGAHGGMDRDLLCVQLPELKPTPKPRPVRQPVLVLSREAK